MAKDWAADLAHTLRRRGPRLGDIVDLATVSSVSPLRIDVQGMEVDRQIWLPAAIHAGADPAGPLAVGDTFLVALRGSAVILLQRVVQAV